MFKYFLAPLEDYAGPAMRKICFDNGADLTFSEMTRVEGIVRNNKATLSKVEIKDNAKFRRTTYVNGVGYVENMHPNHVNIDLENWINRINQWLRSE